MLSGIAPFCFKAVTVWIADCRGGRGGRGGRGFWCFGVSAVFVRRTVLGTLQKSRESEFPPTEEVSLPDFDDVGGGFVVAEFGEVVTAEREFEEEGFVGGILEFSA